ncbi:MAG: RtcB family protein [Pseudomonadota bacterium]
MPPITCKRLDKNRLIIPKQGKMNVDGIIYANHKLEKDIAGDNCLEQVANVACLPGIVRHSLAMPDIHSGYGFPIGGVAAFDLNEGIISPGGVGYDINCGVRFLKTNIHKEEIEKHIEDIIYKIFSAVPSGVGSKSQKGLAEEMPEAYKDVVNVIDVIHDSQIAVKVAKVIPLGVVKG